MAMLTLNRFLLHIRATQSSSRCSEDHPEEFTMADLPSSDPFDKSAKHRTLSSGFGSRPVVYYDNCGHPLEIDVKEERLSDRGESGVWEIIVEP